MIYLELFLGFFQIGLFSIGGGYASLPLIQSQVVEKHGWLTLTQFTDIITISQMTPGPIAINASTFVGVQVGGIPGALIATFGCVLPSFIIVLTLGFFYYKYRDLKAVNGVLQGMKPAVVAMIASAGLSITILALFGANTILSSFKDINFIAVGIFSLGLFILRKFKLNPIYVILGSGIVGIIVYQFV